MNILRPKKDRDRSNNCIIKDAPRSDLLPEIYTKYSEEYRNNFDDIFRKDRKQENKENE